jgi:hypothetical protein
LHGHDAALGLDPCDANGSIRSGAGQHDAGCPIAVLFGQRLQQDIERLAGAMGWRSGNMQHAIGDGEVTAGWDDVEVARGYRRSIRRFENGQLGVRGQQGRHHAPAAGIGVLDQDEGRGSLWRPGLDQSGRGFQTAGRSADADHGKRGLRDVAMSHRRRSGVLRRDF